MERTKIKKKKKKKKKKKVRRSRSQSNRNQIKNQGHPAMDGRESNTLVLVGESGVKDLLDACGVTKFACRTSNDYQVLVFLFLFCFLSEKKKIFCFSLVLCDPITFQLLLMDFCSFLLLFSLF